MFFVYLFNMKFIITENQKERIVLNWMNKNFSPDQLEVIEHPDYPNSIFYRKNGKVVMEQDKKNQRFWFSYTQIWSFFKSFFSMEYEEIQGVLNIWLEEAFKLKGYTPSYSSLFPMTTVGRGFQIEGLYALRWGVSNQVW